MRAFKFKLILLTVLMMLFMSMAGLSEAGQLAGKLIDENSDPMKGVIVFFFNADSGPPPSPDIYWKAPEETTGTDKGGGFTVELPEGNYYFGARDDVAWQHSGPPKGEDIFFLGTGPGKGLKTISVKDNKKNDAGTISVKDMVKIMVRDSDGITTIKGTVLNQDGVPAADIVVEAYSSLSGEGEFPYVSDYTGAEGLFIMRLHEGGKYYLRTRSRYKGRSPGDADPVEVTVSNGDTLGDINLTVK